MLTQPYYACILFIRSARGQLSSIQLAGAIMVGVEAKNAGVITGILGRNESLITAGVSAQISPY